MMHARSTSLAISPCRLLVSVIIPCWNVEDVVGQALESAVGQSCEVAEIICVDDGSVDGTHAVLRAFADRYPTIRVVGGPHRGAAAARNAGLALARGEYVQFLDADDLLHPRKIEHQAGLVAAASPRPELVAGAYETQLPDGARTTSRPDAADPWVGLIRTRLGHTSANLWRREAVLAAGGWDEGLRSSQEYDLLFRMLERDAQVLIDERSLTTVRHRPGSISHTDIGGNLERYIDLRIRIRDHLRASGALTAPRSHVIERALFGKIHALAKYDLPAAERLYRHVFPRGLRVKPSPGVSAGYAVAHRLLGFPTAQRTVGAFRWLRTLGRDPVQ
jgi:glycosyltransferase involved in cell wall biosynthesis